MKKYIQEITKDFIRPMGIFDLISEWGGFVKWCEGGYEWNIYEYSNEMSPRKYIEKIINAPEFNEEPERKKILTKIEELDSCFKDLLQDGIETKGNYWWEKGVLKYAGPVLVQDYKELYNIDILLKKPN